MYFDNKCIQNSNSNYWKIKQLRNAFSCYCNFVFVTVTETNETNDFSKLQCCPVPCMMHVCNMYKIYKLGRCDSYLWNLKLSPTHSRRGFGGGFVKDHTFPSVGIPPCRVYLNTLKCKYWNSIFPHQLQTPPLHFQFALMKPPQSTSLSSLHIAKLQTNHTIHHKSNH